MRDTVDCTKAEKHMMEKLKMNATIKNTSIAKNRPVYWDWSPCHDKLYVIDNKNTHC